MANERENGKDLRKEKLDEEREEFRRLAETRDPKLREKIITDHLYMNLVRLSLAQEMQRQPTVDEIAERLGVSAEQVLEAMEASKVYAPQSLDKTLDTGVDDQEMSFGDLIGEEDERFNEIDFNDVVDRLSATLNDLEKRIFLYRYFEKRTQISIAEELEISQMTVSRIEKKIIKKFRQELQIPVQSGKKKR